MRSFDIADLFKEAFIIRTPELPAITEANRRMENLTKMSPAEVAELPDRDRFTPFAAHKAYIIRPEDALTGGISYLDLHRGYSAFLMEGDCKQVEEIVPADGKGFHLPQVYEVTGRPIDVVCQLPGLPKHIMLINDEGWLEAEPQHNMMASLIAGRPIAGTVIVCPDYMFE